MRAFTLILFSFQWKFRIGSYEQGYEGKTTPKKFSLSGWRVVQAHKGTLWFKKWAINIGTDGMIQPPGGEEYRHRERVIYDNYKNLEDIGIQSWTIGYNWRFILFQVQGYLWMIEVVENIGLWSNH